MTTYLLFLLIPVAMMGIYWYITKDFEIALISFIIAIVAGGIFIGTSFYIQKFSKSASHNYTGYYVLKAEYYEYWETWVDRTCTRTVTDSKGNTRTVSYDCSYCDRNSEYWVTVDNAGNNMGISQLEFERLRRIWGDKLTKVDMKRKIHKNWRCGEDGDMYYINWNKKIEDSKVTTYKNSYSNHIKFNRSAFGYMDVKNKPGLYLYPSIQGDNFQNTVMGTKYLSIDKDTIKRYLNFFNGYRGMSNKIRVFTMFFKDKPLSTALDQESLWIGGNENELNVCIGLKPDGKTIDWVHVFTWQDEKTLKYNLEKEIRGLGEVSSTNLYYVYDKHRNDFKYKDFRDFQYIEYIPTSGEVKFVLIGIVVICIVSIFAVNKMEY